MRKKLLMLIVAVFVLCGTAFAQTTSFTYQGRLTDSGNPANGNYDLQFGLWDNSSGGAQIGSTQTKNSVAVNAGIFTVALDFGVSAFPGANRFLEISVRPTGGGGFTILSPRQQISSTPYAIRTLTAATADTATNATQLGGVLASQYVQTTDTRLSDARSPTPGSSNYIQSNPSAQQSGANFNISGNGTAGGTLSGNAVNSATQFNIGGNRVLSVAGTSNLFAGLSAGQVNTSGASNAFFGQNAGLMNTVGAGNAFFGFNAGRNNVGDAFGNGSNNSFFGGSAGQGNTGQQNSYFGSGAGVANSAGNFNSFFGQAAGFANTGSNNSFFGSNTGANNTADGNSFFGLRAGFANTSGSSNSFFGSQAGVNNQKGSRNTFIGADAGNADPNSEGSDSTAVGANAATSFVQAVAVGSGASADFGSTAVGKGALASGFLSIAIGNGAKATGLNSISIGANITTPETIGIGPGDGTFKTVIPGVLSVGQSVETVGTAVLNLHNGGLVFDSSGQLVVNGDAGPLAFNSTGLGVKTLSPVQTLDVNGRARIRSVPFTGESTTPVCVTFFGDIVACSSSLRFKTNIHPFLGGLDLVLKLTPINFNWKVDGRPDVGLGAEDVANVAPTFAITDSKGEITGVKYDRLNILLINAVKEQQEEIEQLRGQILQLRATRHRRGRR
jgi:hypothetical protein